MSHRHHLCGCSVISQLCLREQHDFLQGWSGMTNWPRHFWHSQVPINLLNSSTVLIIPSKMDGRVFKSMQTWTNRGLELEPWICQLNFSARIDLCWEIYVILKGWGTRERDKNKTRSSTQQMGEINVFKKNNNLDVLRQHIVGNKFRKSSTK